LETVKRGKPALRVCTPVPPSGGSLEIGNRVLRCQPGDLLTCSPFGGIPRNWKQISKIVPVLLEDQVPPSGGSLEIGNLQCWLVWRRLKPLDVPPSGGSLEIGNRSSRSHNPPPFGCSPFGGIPRNWKRLDLLALDFCECCSPFGGIPRNWKLSFTSDV